MANQPDLFDSETARSLLDQLLEDSRLYYSGADYLKLLDFIVKLRNFAPFNAMLLQIQKPGIGYAASAFDWSRRFNRRPKRDARPLLILWPFGPVALVYDVEDTEGDPLPDDVRFFQASGEITQEKMKRFMVLLGRKSIKHVYFDGGDRKAGSIEFVKPSGYLIRLNQNHDPNVQFSTLAHELGHLFLGHLGANKKLNIPPRVWPMSQVQMELEAESAAYLACQRNGVKCKSKVYLANYVKKHQSIENLDIYQIVRAVGQMETLLGLTAHTRYELTRIRN